MKAPKVSGWLEALLNLAGKVIDKFDPPRIHRPTTERHDAQPITPDELTDTVKTKARPKKP